MANLSIPKIRRSRVWLVISSVGSTRWVLIPFSLWPQPWGEGGDAFCIDHPERVEKLIVVDIAPRDYPPEHHALTLDAMLGLDLAKLGSKKEADDALSKTIPNWAFRQFLLTNLGENDSGFAWKPNLRALRNSIAELSVNPLDETERYDGPALFVCGGKSGYVRSEHFPSIKKHFPQSQITVLAEAGHDAHVEDREGFVQALRSFLAG